MTSFSPYRIVVVTYVSMTLLSAVLQLRLEAVAQVSTPAQIYAAAAPAVVLIIASSDNGAMSGTGSIIDGQGLVLTNSHVIFDTQAGIPYRNIWVFLKPNRIMGDEISSLGPRLPVVVIAYDPSLDLALLKVTHPPKTLPVLPIGDPTTITIGSRVMAIGHPEQGGLWSLTTGVISAEWENISSVPGKNAFQTEVGLNRGNSGGPLIDERGHQIGVNTSMARKSKDGLAITSISFALKSSVAKEWLDKQGVTIAYAKPNSSSTADNNEGPSQTTDFGAQGARTGPKKQPAMMLENQPEARPETGPGLPRLRPFNLDRLMRGLTQVSDDLESQMEEMQQEIQKRR